MAQAVQQQRPHTELEKTFIGGFKTEFTGLNFPENACTETNNCVFSLLGDVSRREGIDFESNYAVLNKSIGEFANSSYRWKNAGGDGNTEVLVVQIGSLLIFYLSSAATTASPLSTQVLNSIVNINIFVASGGVFDSTLECQYTTGNGYLFVFHPNCDPFYVTFTNGAPPTVVASMISVKIRDFDGIVEAGVADNFRPNALTDEHNYNLQNQGWTSRAQWSTVSSTSNNTSIDAPAGFHTWTVPAGLSIVNGDTVNMTAVTTFGFSVNLVGTVTNYVGTQLSIKIIYTTGSGFISTNWTFTSTGTSKITDWHTGAVSVGGYPSNADVWWNFKDSSGVFNPSTTINNVTLGTGPAPNGHFILSAFNLDRSANSGVSNLTPVSTLNRPKTGTWFQGRVWYAGVDASFSATGDIINNYTWTENIYFSQIITNITEAGKCYPSNDPTSENEFTLLPTDGGVIKIQGAGSIYKLFPLHNALIVFAANGIWIITGSTGIGFTADDFTVSKISSIQSISGTSFIDVQGFPMFWNEEGIYYVDIQKDSGSIHSPDVGLSVENLTLGTILGFYNTIPKISKKYARGDYHPIDYVVQWAFRSTNETNVQSRYQFDTILNFNTVTKAFYLWTVSNSGNALTPFIRDIRYVNYPAAATAPDPDFKYFSSFIQSAIPYYTFSDSNDFIFKDWSTTSPVDYTSDFTAGYRLGGLRTGSIMQGVAEYRHQVPFLFLYTDNNTKYKVQCVWDYAILSHSNKFSINQVFTNISTDFSKLTNRLRLRGRGRAFQLKVQSISGQPFHIDGWGLWTTTNVGV